MSSTLRHEPAAAVARSCWASRRAVTRVHVRVRLCMCMHVCGGGLTTGSVRHGTWSIFAGARVAGTGGRGLPACWGSGHTHCSARPRSPEVSHRSPPPGQADKSCSLEPQAGAGHSEP